MMEGTQAKDAPSRSSMLSKNGVALVFLQYLVLGDKQSRGSLALAWVPGRIWRHSKEAASHPAIGSLEDNGPHTW